MAYRIVRTAWGWCGLIGERVKITRILLPVSTKAKMRRRIARQAKEAEEDAAAFPVIVDQLKRYFAGKKVTWHWASIDLRGTPFQRRVWRAAMAIPYGETRSYGWIARRTGRRGAARAVGGAMARNPLPLIVTCHRVLRSDGGLGGFSAEEGVALKRKLLDLESKVGV